MEILTLLKRAQVKVKVQKKLLAVTVNFCATADMWDRI